MRVRDARPNDSSSIVRIVNEAIDERSSFESAHRSESDVVRWFDGTHPIVVVEDERGEIIAFARAEDHSARDWLRGIFDLTFGTARDRRRHGAGSLAVRELVARSRAAGASKLVARMFVENRPCRSMIAAIGFREVGIHYRHVKLDGQWRDVVSVEMFLAPAGAEALVGPPPGYAPREQILQSLRAETIEARAQGLEAAHARLDVYRKPDDELLDAVVAAFFAPKLRDAASRAHFVDFFRIYASLAQDSAGDSYEALFQRLDHRSIANELDAFYETAFVIKQVASTTPERARTRDLAPHVGRLLDWTKQTIDLPPGLRGRISPGNVVPLLLSLAFTGSATDDQKRQVGDLATEAKTRHRIESPASIRPPPPPPAPAPAPKKKRTRSASARPKRTRKKV